MTDVDHLEPDTDSVSVHVDRLRRFVTDCGKYARLSDLDLQRFVDGLIEADLRGVDSHGSVRVQPYVRSLVLGTVNPHPNVRYLRSVGATALLDGDNGLGVITGQIAMESAIELASKFGVGVVSVRRSSHCGMLAFHVLRAVERDMIGYFTSNAPPMMAAFGGGTAKLSNSPFAYAFPSGRTRPIVVDMACSQVARGKIRLAAQSHQQIPSNWAVDRSGRPTSDPHEALLGSLLPMAGYKGYGIAVANEVLSAVLSGASLSCHVSTASLAENSSHMDTWNSGHLAVALSVDAFAEITAFKAEVDQLVYELKSSTSSNSPPVLVPGEPEWNARDERLSSGIPISKATLDRLDSVASEFNVTPLLD